MDKRILCQSAKDNGAKIRFYTENNTDHKQIIIEGKRPSGAKWKLICDEKLKDVITDLNNNGISTLWSCEGKGYCHSNITDETTFDPAYITIRYPSTLKLFALAGNIIRNHFANCIILRSIDDCGRLNFKIYDVVKYQLSPKQLLKYVIRHKESEIAMSEAYVMD
ncbi:MAG: hypothetical protein IKA36_06295 [Clostridia bacterium]|nr:hypothetical protein [Clostridia bacterium]